MNKAIEIKDDKLYMDDILVGGFSLMSDEERAKVYRVLFFIANGLVSPLSTMGVDSSCCKELQDEIAPFMNANGIET